jgi:dipeptide/tripeptide permease
MGNLDPIVIAILIPLLDRIVYPFLRRHGYHFRPITRIALGFLIGAISMFYASYLQSVVYDAPPCYGQPLTCPEARLPDGTIAHNRIHIAWQSPAYALIALSEILCSVTGLEYAYTKAPKSMKSFIMSIFLLTNAGGAILGVLAAPWAKDPNMSWFYLGLGLVSMGFGIAFWTKFKHLDAQEDVDEMVRADVLEEEAEAVGAAGMPAIPLTSLATEHPRSRTKKKSRPRANGRSTMGDEQNPDD